ncbi:hypothetical protein DFH05DRAFT_394014 [Lentinula detonsa]|uniref:NADH dehydrogenase [ubiquinone] 1 beta subcomplex subunit 9 n=2 Tax=Lentinula TaxID=5352 RepID=A0AA38KLH0_9AGAR|nr:hypothetical protein DFH05DRAFT_394014 [Lentinula detonsa]KAJ3780825.1 hypothetical protein GGU10DRAFT_368484 [Lentinula aff. detonsa]KAJ3796742.1 hypothetical protein GGU11DRAFT_816913 [Lentinula aff. detonsa]
MSTPTFSAAHRRYVKSLYRRMLTDSLNWTIHRELWRRRALVIRAEFESNRNVHDPRELAVIFDKAEADLARNQHPDPVISPLFPGGTKWERNIPPPMGPLYDHLAADAH